MIPTEEANRTIDGTKCGIASGANLQLTSGAFLWPNLKLMQEVLSFGQICNQLVNLSYRLNSLGTLCHCLDNIPGGKGWNFENQWVGLCG